MSWQTSAAHTQDMRSSICCEVTLQERGLRFHIAGLALANNQHQWLATSSVESLLLLMLKGWMGLSPL